MITYTIAIILPYCMDFFYKHMVLKKDFLIAMRKCTTRAQAKVRDV